MAPKKNKHVYEKGHHFYFKYEPDFPELLHIFVRHRTTTQESIKTFFGGVTIWNERFNRNETTWFNYQLYWFWLDQRRRKIMVITCFTL